MSEQRWGLSVLISAGRSGVVAALAILALARPVRAQDMEPRAYSPSPLGTNFLAVTVGNSSGAVLFDPSVPITDTHADLNSVVVGYARTIRLGGRQGLVAAMLPFVRGDIAGKVLEESR